MMPTYYMSFISVLGLLHLFCMTQKVDSAVITNSTRIKEGILRYHYSYNFTVTSKNPSCSYLALIGVGTTMRVDEYDILAREMAKQSPDAVVIFIDQQPGNPFKLSARKYAKLASVIAKNARQLVPICQNITKEPKVVLGGHSASGAATLESLAYIEHFHPVGIFGLSPFRISDSTRTNDLPSLFWGFSRTTCAVIIGNAADKAYELSDPHNGRVLYQLQNADGHPSHCVFANNGCLPVCPSPKVGVYSWVRSAVASSLEHFLRAIETANFSRATLELPLPGPNAESHLKMFVNADKIPTDEVSFAFE